MRKERLNKKFLNEFRQLDFSSIKEERIYLVGSARFKEHFIKIESILQIIHKKIVNVCSIDGLLNKKKFSGVEWEQLQSIALKKLHYQDAILVLNINDYLGEHSKEEIKYFSNNLNKPIYYLSDLF
ncbi:MAG: hypothetical protein ACFFA2_14835, partial [Promethearchaeota archaeon]